jgi:hypothetical protein
MIQTSPFTLNSPGPKLGSQLGMDSMQDTFWNSQRAIGALSPGWGSVNYQHTRFICEDTAYGFLAQGPELNNLAHGVVPLCTNLTDLQRS